MNSQQQLQLIDIYDIVYQPWWLSSTAKIGYTIFIFLLGVGVGYLIYKKTRKPLIIPYWQQALYAIAALEKEGYANGQQFYLRLTEIMKCYLQEKYGVALLDKTDTELLEILKATPAVPAHVFDTIKELFDGVIFIKFAHQEAAQERMESAVKKSRELIQSQLSDQPN